MILNQVEITEGWGLHWKITAIAFNPTVQLEGVVECRAGHG